MAKKSIAEKVFSHLQKGKTLTTSQIIKKFGAGNPRDAAYRIEQWGYTVLREYKRTKNGFRAVKYSMTT